MCSCVGTHTLGTLTGKQLPLAQWLSLVLQTHILIAFPFLAWLIVADLHTCAIYALEEGTATHCSTVAWRIPMDRGAWQATVYGVAKSRAQQKQLSTHTHYISRWLRGKKSPAKQETRSLGQEDTPREGNGNPLQYSCLGNPMDRGAWRATLKGAAKELDTI